MTEHTLRANGGGFESRMMIKFFYEQVTFGDAPLLLFFKNEKEAKMTHNGF